ncbi:MAG: Trk system potassium transporter TrkA [Clostridia bacterium]|nr:Trk system potassium transporter TrkA [Clostridia bacterium]
MRLIVVGLGETGIELAKELVLANHEVTVIDIEKNKVEEFTNEYDALGVAGSGASKAILMQAKANMADIIISVTSNDEVNLMSAITAKTLGTKHSIVKVSSKEYKDDEKYLGEKMGIDMVINAEQDTADEITRIVSYPSNMKTGIFSNGKVDMAEIKVKEDTILADTKLVEFKEKFNAKVTVVSIIRDEKLVVPRGDVTIKAGDEICIIGKHSEIYKFLNKLNLIDKPVKNILIIGCGGIGEQLLENLSEMNLKIKLIEFDKERCIEIVEKFPNVNVIHGNGIDSDMLIEEGIKDFDCCISITGADETNLVVTLFAWSCKVRKLITKIVSLSYSRMLHNVQIDNTLSPHLIILGSIHRFIRGIENNSMHVENIKSLYRFAKNKAEAIEFEATNDLEFLGKKISEINLKKDIVIAFIIRNKKVIIPHGETTIEENDKVMIIASADKNIGRLSEIVE